MSASERPLRLLFVCTHNCARSILAEGLANQLGSGRLLASSAGSHPMGRVHPAALAVLGERGCDVHGLRSKPLQECVVPAASAPDIVITVCDAAAREACPVLTDNPVHVHWGLPDPSRVEGTAEAQRAAFRRTADLLEARLRALLALDFDAGARQEMARQIQAIHDTLHSAEQAA